MNVEEILNALGRMLERHYGKFADNGSAAIYAALWDNLLEALTENNLDLECLALYIDDPERV